jgi:hypothetical protein
MSEAYLSSGKLAALIGRSRETIRRYEALGLIPVGRRDPINGRRYWPVDEAESIRRQLRPVATRPGPDPRPARGAPQPVSGPGNRP